MHIVYTSMRYTYIAAYLMRGFAYSVMIWYFSILKNGSYMD